MHPQEAEQFIRERISVTRQAVTIAKAYAIKNYQQDARGLIESYLRDMDAVLPKQVVIHPSVDSTPSLTKAAESISWQLAMGQAIWELIHSNVFIPVDFSIVNLNFDISWTTVVPGSGGQSADWHLGSFSVPSRIRFAPSWQNSTEEILTDGDLYLREINIANIHPEIVEALRDAVKCLRAELYTPALAMLAKACEGAWLELGAALVKALPDAAKVSGEKYRAKLDDPNISLFKKIQLVLDLYQHSGLEPLRTQSGLEHSALQEVSVWSNIVRESRNVVHYGVTPSMPNTYEKVAALFIAALPNLRVMYTIHAAANEIAKTKVGP